MSALKYEVQVAYTSTGLDSFSNPLSKVKDTWSKDMGRSVSEVMGSMTSGFNNVFDSAAAAFTSTMAGAAVTVGAAVAGALGFALKEGLNFNAFVESSTNGLAATFQMLGDMSLDKGLKQASDVVEGLRRKAALLPGEFKDALAMMSAITPAGMNNRIAVPRLENIAAMGVAAAAALNIPQHVAARELGKMLDGQAKGSMPLVSRLGIHAADWNKLSADKRFGKIENMFGKLEPSMTQFQGSWAGLTSTTRDNARNVARTFAAPLFGTIKGELERVLEWFGKNENAVHAFASRLGNRVNDAFIWAKGELVHWVPIAWHFGQTIYAGLHNAFSRVEPFMHRLAGVAERFMGDPQAFDKIVKVAGILAGIRVGAGVAGLGFSGLGELMTLGKSLGFVAGGFDELALVMGPAALAIGALAVATEGAVHILTDKDNPFHGVATNSATDSAKHMIHAGDQLGKLGSAMQPVADIMGVYLVEHVNMLATSFDWLATGARGVGDLLAGISNFEGALGMKARNALGWGMRPDEPMKIDRDFDYGRSVKAIDAGAERETDHAVKPPNVTNHITQTIKIEVNGTEDPDRVAKTVWKEIKNQTLYPTTSPEDRGQRIRDARSY